MMSSSPGTRNPLRSKPDPAPKQDVDALSSSIGLDLGVKGPLGVDAAQMRTSAWPATASGTAISASGARTGCSTTSSTGRSSSTRIGRRCGSSTSMRTPRGSCGSRRWRGPCSRWPSSRRTASPPLSLPRPTSSTRRSRRPSTWRSARSSAAVTSQAIGLPLPPPPPPVLRYDNVPVLVRYSQATYEPFRVRRIIDVGDDARFGERKVLLDGATPAWGVWTQTPSGERQFEVHRTQQFPGLDDPQEAPLPGDYQLRLASDESSSGLTGRDMFLYVAAGVTVALGFGAIALALGPRTSAAATLRRVRNERGAPVAGAPLLCRCVSGSGARWCPPAGRSPAGPCC